jgi:hypothetical protein
VERNCDFFSQKLMQSSIFFFKIRGTLLVRGSAGVLVQKATEVTIGMPLFQQKGK